MSGLSFCSMFFFLKHVKHTLHTVVDAGGKIVPLLHLYTLKAWQLHDRGTQTNETPISNVTDDV